MRKFDCDAKKVVILSRNKLSLFVGRLLSQENGEKNILSRHFDGRK